MTRQWIRDCRLSVEGGGTSIDLSSLRIRFQVTQNNLQSPNVADVMVTNPSPETAKRIQKEGQKITLEAGYEQGHGIIFKGDLIQKRIGRENPVDTYLSLLATSGDRAYNFSTVSRTLGAGSTFRDIVNVALEAMRPYGITEGYIADLGSAKMPRARTLFGMARDVLRDVATSTKTSWSIQNDKLYIVKNQDSLPDTFVVNSRTGMIGLPQQTLDGIVVRMLLNPRVIPGTKIRLDQGSVQEQQFSANYTAEVNNAMIPSLAEDGVYKVLVSNHHGDTRGNPWYTEVTCIRADGQGPLPIRLASQGINLDPAPAGGQ